jgi:hypothetical protein
MAEKRKSKMEENRPGCHVFAIFNRKTFKMTWLIICSVYFFCAGIFWAMGFNENGEAWKARFAKLPIGIFWLPLVFIFLFFCFTYVPKSVDEA